MGRGLGIFPARPKTPFVPGEATTRDKRTFCPGSWLHPGQKAPPHIFPSSFALLLTLGFSSAPVLLPPPREPSTAAIDVAAAQSPDLTPPPRATAAAVTPRPRHHPLLAVDPPLQAIPAHAAYPKVELDLLSPLQHRALTESPCLSSAALKCRCIDAWYFSEVSLPKLTNNKDNVKQYINYLGHQIGNEASQNYYSVHPESDLSFLLRN